MATADVDVWEPIQRLDRDLRSASRLLGQGGARYLVDYYYQLQKFRIASAAQVRSSDESGEPDRVLNWVSESTKRLENDIKLALGEFARTYTVGLWLQSLVGIGDVISAGFLAHIDVRECKTAGHFWRFAGLDPTVSWEKKTKRPWNAKLKTLCYKVGESFVKFQNHDDDFYGKLFRDRKRQEVRFNSEGRFSEQANQVMAAKRIGKDTDAYAWYAGCLKPSILDDGWEDLSAEQRMAKLKRMKGEPGSGMPMLPPAHIHARARRYAVKLFLSHMHHVMHVDYFGSEPPMPYAFVKCPGDHRHYIPPPGWPMGEAGKPLAELLK